MKQHLSLFTTLLVAFGLVAGIPFVEAAPENTAKISSEEVSVNINTAKKEELLLVGGIGPKLADRIISYRTENGSFTNLFDIMEVNGIGEMKFEKIKSQIKV